MAKSLSSMLLKGISGIQATRSCRIVSGSFYHYGIKYSSSVPDDPDTHDDFKPINKLKSSDISWKDVVERVSGSFYYYGMKYSSSVPDDPDTHDDFKPINKLKSSDISLKDVVERDVKDNPIMIYMRGVPDLPQGGFSSLAVTVLKLYNVPLSTRNILENFELKNAVKAYSNWPTFPQIFIRGEFIGGSDIILNMHQSGELKEKLKDVTSNQEKS